MSTVKSSFLIFILCIALSCSRELYPEEYVRAIEENSKRNYKEITYAGITVNLCYMPSEYYAARDMVSDVNLQYSRATERYKNSIFFILSIQRNTVGNMKYSEIINQNSFNRNNDVFLYNGIDTVKVESYQYARGWGIDNETFLFAFSQSLLKSELKDYHLVFRNITSQFGTVDLKVNNLLKPVKKLKGKI